MSLKAEHRNNTPETNRVMETLSEERTRREFTYWDMATRIEAEFSYRITGDQYRACEQGLTRKVPLDVLLYSARILDLSPEDVLGAVLSDEWYNG